jgi:hypothetical protein
MGNSSSSSITNAITNKNINTSMIENINKNSSTIMTDTIVSNKTSSQGGSSQVANIKTQNISAIGVNSSISGLTLLIDQNAKIQFNADDKSIQNNDIMVDYALKLTQQIQNSISNEQAAKLASESSATQKNDFLSFSIGNQVKSDVNNQITQINKNENITKLFNQITNTIQQNSSTLNFKECIMNNLQSGSIEIGQITAQDGGKIDNITIGINQAIDVIQNCVFTTLQASNITTQIAQDMGFTIVNDTKNKQESESTAKSSAVQENLGLVSLIGASGIYSLISIALCFVLVIVIFIVIKSAKGTIVDAASKIKKSMTNQ